MNTMNMQHPIYHRHTLPFILGHLLSIQKNNFHTRVTKILLQITLED